jgi:LuxR family maltose regulon positive regulatory protein
MYVGMSEIHRERDDLPAATRCLLRSQDLGEHTGLPQNPYRWRVAMARIREAEGDLDGALDLLNEAERLYVSDFFPDVRPIPAMKARLWVALGRLGEALGWAREKGLSIEDDLSYLREFEHITLARLLLGQYAAERGAGFLEEATELLERLLRAAEAGARTGTVIEILVLQALANQAQGNIPAGLASLERVLTLSEPEGYVRIFVNEGTPMASLLRAVAKRKIAPSYVRRLLTALSETEETTPVKQSLIEPLSERELEVIRLLGTDLDGPDIARQLVVSLNTVRTHQEHLRQARREQSSGSGTPTRSTQPPPQHIVIRDAHRP